MRFTLANPDGLAEGSGLELLPVNSGTLEFELGHFAIDDPGVRPRAARRVQFLGDVMQQNGVAAQPGFLSRGRVQFGQGVADEPEGSDKRHPIGVDSESTEMILSRFPSE